MSLDVTIPQLGKIKSNAKDLVVSILAEEYPLTLTRMHRNAKKKFHSVITFQGIRKAVAQLEESKVILKEGKEYSLNKEWMSDLRDFLEKIEEVYYSESKVQNIESLGEDIKVYTLKNLIDTDKFLNRLIEKWFNESPGKTYLQKAGHAYFMVGNLEEESRINEIMKKHKIKFYTLIGGKSKLDKSLGEYFKSQGFHYKCGSGETLHYYGVYGNNFFQYEVPKLLAEEIDKIYNKTLNYESLDIATLILLLRKENSIKITVMKNSLMAKQLGKNILSYFK